MYFRRPPHPALAEHIDYYWHVSDTPQRERVHVVPSGTLEIAINLRADEIRICDPSDPEKFAPYSGAVISGAQSRYFVIDTPDRASIIGVHFKPGGAFALIGVPPGTLTDMHVSLEGLWGAPAIALRERLCGAGNPEARFQILDGTFLQRLRASRQPRGEVTFALARLLKTNARVDSVAAEVDLSHRRFIELFATEVGVAPKVFSRVGRFQRAFALAKQEEAPAWTQTALACGYFDQSHLIREFVSLSGLPPTELLHRSADAKGHHAALAARSKISKTRAERLATLRR